MKWERAGKYAIRSGDWIISKCFVDGAAVYGLWCRGKNQGYFDDLVQAKRMAVEEKEAA